jgi:putative spermidine/putrescine transport system substrate-binding protein
LKRRPLLFSLLALGACGGQEPVDLTVETLTQAWPTGETERFKARTGIKVQPWLKGQPEEIFKELKTQFEPAPERNDFWKDLTDEFFPTPAPAASAGVYLLGDAWLAKAISYLEPLEPKRLKRLSNLAPQSQKWGWAQGKCYGIPYRFGTAMVAYNRQRAAPIKSWEALWQGPDRKITLPDSPREVFAIALKRLGYSLNSLNPNHWQEAYKLLQALQPKVLTYSSNYLPILLTEDSWVAVGWSADLYSAAQDNPEIGVTIPEEGTSLWADLWVLPRKASPDSFYRLVDYLLEAEVLGRLSTQFSVLNPYPDSYPKVFSEVREDPLVFPPMLDRCELIQLLPPDLERLVQELWKALRTSA